MLQNKLSILFLLIFIISFSFAASAQKEELRQEIYAYYPLDGNTIDQGPNQLHGKQINKERSTEDRFGKSGKALSFTGKNDFITLPVNINPEIIPQLTIAFWLKVETADEINTIISNNVGGFARTIVIDGRKNYPFLSIIAGDKQKLYGTINIPQNQWFFTAVSWNAENGNISIYLIDQNNNFRVISTNNIKPDKGKDFITLGKNNSTGAVFRGSIDQLMIWDKILTGDEIKKLANKSY
ncbi:concanavalin A-like lectin/glucanase superfamily protein [Halanaerobium saccharolyticum]|uniref:Concanavalin A-like lectin/glucanase superfamily protein n=1 Tax=Halanaerobium saccharolyticum TaxID=43595 RepID=A0A4R7ZDT5_9FIRM|nr:LamG domain-containing protein [Halanaerobium saccharolyticum]RAK11213.1 concanavalin A-like lectin/glucanase superfamily protein [Halanaerobium saccharolyticum]TDW07064.1 concanavalin A-like lectin/glucanase superfamily protein [Halanaerobium saccharolyticum]TDX63829.1 concanavalin A-like lectin/glucanase superfamily protein [Halanaerobium saccharolyticum]